MADPRRTLVPADADRRVRRRSLPRPGRPRLGGRARRDRARGRLHRRRADGLHDRAWWPARSGSRWRCSCSRAHAASTGSRRSSTSRATRTTSRTRRTRGYLGIANGGLTGSGIGGSNSKLGYLPLAHSDFIFAVIADELGFVGALAVIGGFALLVWFGIQTALAAPDRFGMLLAGGIADVVRGAGDRQHRRRRRPAAGDRVSRCRSSPPAARRCS